MSGRDELPAEPGRAAGTDYAIAREITEVGADVVAAGPPPVPELAGRFSLRLVDPDADAQLLERWFAQPHLAATWEQEWPAERWRRDAAYRLAGDYSRPLIFSVDGREAGYLEAYRAARDEIARVWDVQPHDLGFHVATADVSLLGKGLASQVFRALAEGLLAGDPRCDRVFGDPAANNAPIARAMRKRGWVLLGEFDVRPDRRIALHELTRETVVRDAAAAVGEISRRPGEMSRDAGDIPSRSARPDDIPRRSARPGAPAGPEEEREPFA